MALKVLNRDIGIIIKQTVGEINRAGIDNVKEDKDLLLDKRGKLQKVVLDRVTGTLQKKIERKLKSVE